MALGRRDHHRAHPTDGPTSPLTTNPAPTTTRTRSTGHPKQGRGTPLPTDDHPPSKLKRGRQRSPYDRHEKSRLKRRRTVDQVLFAVVMEAYLHGVSTRKVDDFVRALGADSGISKFDVARICADLDVEVGSFRDRSLPE